jgi:hypothetical protein
MKKVCWAVGCHGKFAGDRYLVGNTSIAPYDKAVHTALFTKRKAAQVWIEENQHWKNLGAKPVKVKVTITEV